MREEEGGRRLTNRQTETASGTACKHREVISSRKSPHEHNAVSSPQDAQTLAKVHPQTREREKEMEEGIKSERVRKTDGKTEGEVGGRGWKEGVLC